ncbi:hypothetical protein SK128_013910 [Halocaridina rubra]|uniref:Uncharacterized protein n=1 Tax=Halocaridina rubra TaxID=373956 RepID=A0AAN8X786_HALRR
MATYDDRQWILSHIQNSYVTSDDTGLCEVVVQPEPGAASVVEFPFLAESESPPYSQEDPPPHSLEIASGFEPGICRVGVHTAELQRSLKERELNCLLKSLRFTDGTTVPV